MGTTIRMISGACVLVALAFPAPAEGPRKPAPPTEPEIRDAIQKLGDERFAVRQRAMKLLWNAGEAAEKFLREAANGSDAEVARQVRMLLERIVYRIDPDTPPDIVSLLQRFRNAEGLTTEQSQVVRDMLRLGSKAHKHLLRMLDAVEERQRRLIIDEFAYDDWKVLAALVGEGQEAIVEQLLDKAIATQNESVVPHFAAYQALAGRLDLKIALFRTRAEKNNQVFDARVLLALCRLKGDAEGTLWAARRTQNPLWLRQILMEQGRWQELLDEQRTRNVQASGLSQVAELGYLAAYQRLAGKEAELPETIKRIQEYVGEPSPRNNRPWYAAKVLLVNERPREAMDLLRKYDQRAAAAELLAGQGKYREALALTEQGAQAESGAKYADRALHVDFLLRVGDRDRAREWLHATAKDMGESTEPGWLDRLSILQVRLGERGEVEKRLLARLEKNDGSALSATFAALFPRLGARGEVLWQMMRAKTPDEDPARRLARMRLVEEGRATQAEVADLLKSPAPVSSHNGQPNFEGVAQLVALLRQPEAAEALLAHPTWEKASPAARLWLADALADAGRWPAAAAAYHKVWEQDRAAPLPLFLHAQMLFKLNPGSAEAKALVERSHRIPLGGDSARYNFHDALVERGFPQDAAREVEFCSRLLTNSPWILGAAQDKVARRLAHHDEALAAATIFERNVLRVMPINSGFVGPSGYHIATAAIHIYRAQGLLARGKKDEAHREVERAEQLYPGNLNLGIAMVPALVKAGEQEQADQLFRRVAAPWRTACADYPGAANAHNQVAWLCARCRRDLDEALVHARKAVELAPESASYHDTLAEVLFQRGDRARAVDLIRKCLTMPSANVGFYRQQLQRFQTGDPHDEPAED